MSEYLTTRQLHKLLKIDRVTVYRMLNDGRLKGAKIGHQWRFSQDEIDRLLGEEKPGTDPANAGPPEAVIADFPVDCVTRLQEIFAGIIGIGAVTVTRRGEPLTEPALCNPFCKLLWSSPNGRRACQESWKKVALHTTGEPPFQVCHAGLAYLRSKIELDGQPAAWLLAGQCYLHAANREKERERLGLDTLAGLFDLAVPQITEAAGHIPVLSKSQVAQVREWTPKVAGTITSILCERAVLTDRLQRIADLSTLRPILKPSD